MKIEEDYKWYCIGCFSTAKELKVRDDARNYGLEAFVPLAYSIKTVKKQKQRTLVPAISGLLFVKGTEDEVKDYVANAHFVVYMKKSTYSKGEDYLTVANKDMETFIAATENNEQHITYYRPDEIKLQPGDQIRVKGGLYDGKEGVVMRIKGKRNKHLVVQIPGILIAAIEMSPELVELKNSCPDKEAPVQARRSKDVEGDKKMLHDYAHRLLFDIKGRYKESSEYYLLLSELKRCRARLAPIKGFTPMMEAELALPMYMAAMATNEGVEEAKARLAKATAKLRDNCKMKLRCLRLLNIED